MATTIPKNRRTAYIVGGVAALLAFLWWRRRSASSGTGIRTTDSGPPAGLQPLGGSAFGSPLMSPSAVTTPTASGLGSPTVAGASIVHAAAPERHPSITGQTGDVAGAPGENRFTFTSASQNKYWAFHGGWQGPGVYEAQKFTDPSHGYTTGTELVKVG